ncbi:hypothetical protein [Yoonia sp. R2-816]|uniref:hypothetical protein n=1 Tax=Yoonia sp. R2-816 TaxID=3342638 RepID=UPI003728D051
MPIFLDAQRLIWCTEPLLLPQTYADIWVVGHPDIWPSRKLSAFRDILIPYCRSHRDSLVA